LFSQNVIFTGRSPPHEDDSWAPGFPIAVALRDGIVIEGWAVSEVDVWRGSGWSFECSSSSQRLDVCLASLGENEWMLQVAPTVVPGWIGRLRGKLPSGTPDTCYLLACVVHRVLASDPRFSGMRWRDGGYPDPRLSTPEPLPPGTTTARRP
jgi:hypothetical protein